jgi:hypothetical protein
MGIFGGAPKMPKATPPPPPLPPPQQVADPLVYNDYQSRVGAFQGLSSTILTGGDGLVSKPGQGYGKPVLGG